MNKKHEVITTFRDKETSQLVLAGSFFETDDKKRLDEMFKRGILKSEETTAVEKEETKPKSSKKATAKKSGE